MWGLSKGAALWSCSKPTRQGKGGNLFDVGIIVAYMASLTPVRCGQKLPGKNGRNMILP